MTIRKAVKNDLPYIFEIYARARNFMAENGNPNQWGDIKPRKELVESDIEKGISYKRNTFLIINSFLLV